MERRAPLSPLLLLGLGCIGAATLLPRPLLEVVASRQVGFVVLVVVRQAVPFVSASEQRVRAAYLVPSQRDKRPPRIRPGFFAEGAPRFFVLRGFGFLDGKVAIDRTRPRS